MSVCGAGPGIQQAAGGMKLLGAWLPRPHHGVGTDGFSMEIGGLSINLDHLAGWVTLPSCFPSLVFVSSFV